MYFCLQVDVCISGGGGGGSLISGTLQYFVISDVWDIFFSRFHSFGVLVRCLSF